MELKSPLEIAHTIKALMVERFSAVCDDPVAARLWYEEEITVWGPDMLATHAPNKVVKESGAAIVLEGSPEGERPAFDCWGVQVSMAEEYLSAIPGWYLECHSCSVIYPQQDRVMSG